MTHISKGDGFDYLSVFFVIKDFNVENDLCVTRHIELFCNKLGFFKPFHGFQQVPKNKFKCINKYFLDSSSKH